MTWVATVIIVNLDTIARMNIWNSSRSRTRFGVLLGQRAVVALTVLLCGLIATAIAFASTNWTFAGPVTVTAGAGGATWAGGPTGYNSRDYANIFDTNLQSASPGSYCIAYNYGSGMCTTVSYYAGLGANGYALVTCGATLGAYQSRRLECNTTRP